MRICFFFFFELLDRSFQKTPTILQITVVTLGCPPRLEGRSLFGGQHIFQTQGPKAPSLELLWVPPPWGPSFMVPEVTMKAWKEGINQQFYPAMIPIYHNSQEGTITRRCSGNKLIITVANSSQIRSLIHWKEGNYDWYWKPSQLSRANEVMNLEG